MNTFIPRVLMGLIFSFILVSSSFAQTAKGGCSSVQVTSVPTYPTNLIAQGAWKPCKSCDLRCEALYFTSPPIYMQTKQWLQRKVISGSGSVSWTTVAGPVYTDNTTFSNLTVHGTYRVRIQIPRRRTSNLCQEGITVLSAWTLGFLGFRGEYDQTNPLSGVSHTNEVVVGNTVPSDRSTTFIDPNGGFLPNGFDFGDQAILGTSDCINYNQWFLAIFESGPVNNRYKSTGWQNSTISSFDLSAFWATNLFEELHQYRVQFVLENKDCRNGIESPNTSNDGWSNMEAFFICPAGSGCRFNVDDREITLAPNPANTGYFELQNFNPTTDQDYQLSIYDMQGRVIRNSVITDNYVDISDFEAGMFIVRVSKEGKPLLQTKLMINR